MPNAQTAWTNTLNGMPRVGDAATRDKTMSRRDIELFTEISGDRNPLHFDEALARASPFGGLIVQGGVTSGLLNALVAQDLPGPGSVFLGMELSFSKAVYVGDTVTARLEIKSVREDKPICKVEVSVSNHKGEVCLSGTATTFTVALKGGT
ncbi:MULTISPECIES: MaoC family dehydratase [Delftia]|uniref:MaoC family dehydratase n=1 Tax=Delftia deserti TaxID=1651218 RepID=A0ABW5EUF1_9BURK|nr:MULTISPECIES: MaoC family dehydratase [Delftia]MBB1653049.1 acyl dehydratase [Delftia sp. UME58]MBL8353689.1 MaoC family dehydratase [Delftia acidovorans]